MATIWNTLRQERHELKADGLAILEIAKSQRTAAQTARLDAIEKRIPTLEREIDAAGAAMEAERKAGTPDAARPSAAAARGKTFAEMFGAASVHGGGWESADQFLAAVHQGLADPRLAYSPTSGLMALGKTSSPADGGYSVPTQFLSQWLDTALEDEIVRPRATVFPMTSGTLMVPGFDGANHTSTLYGGLAGGWIAEAAEIAPQSPKMMLLTMVARKLGILAEVSNELLSDGLGYAEQLSKAIIKAIAFHLDYGFLNGSGVPGPLGVLHSSALITVTKETGQAAGTILYENLCKMFARLHAPSVKNSVWVAHQSTIPMLTTMGIVIGVGGSHIPVMSESDGTFKILTRPVLFTEKVPSLGNAGDIGLYDFSQYGICLRSDMALDKSMHPGFTRDTSHYRGILRGDGLPLWGTAITLKGGTTVSPYVTLGARP